MLSGLTQDFVTEKKDPRVKVSVRKARMSDIARLLEIINSYAAKGIMLPRTEFEMSENMRDFSVAEVQGRVVGCAALHFYSPTMGEIRSLAVDENWKTHGVGRRLIEALVDEANRYELDAVFAFTYVPGFFAKTGFTEVERGVLPLKAWKDCLRCPKFQACDEIPVLRVLRPWHWDANPKAFTPGVEGNVLLPILKENRTPAVENI